MSLGRPTRSLVGAVMFLLSGGRAHPSIGGHHREVSDLDFQVKNLDFTVGTRLAKLQP
jgi:hypothetical protein